MDQHAFNDFETRSNGFLSGIATQNNRIADAVLMTAHYDPDTYSDTLFDTLGISCPPNIARAAQKRKADYLAGRAVALAAMIALNVPPIPIETAPSRAPIWPKGVTGSISHARGRCACLLSQDTGQSFGIDTEAIAQGNTLKAILTETLSEKDRTTLDEGPLPVTSSATLTFSAKEALFKALHPQVGRFFGFDAAELATPPTDSHLTLTLTGDLTPNLRQGQSFTLHTRLTDTHVLTWLAVPTP